MRCQEKENGFTLIELIVVIALISILLSVSLPRIRGSFLSDGTDKFSRWIMNKIPALKSMAMSSRKRHMLTVDLDHNRMWVTDESMTEEKVEAAAEKGYTLPGNVRLTDVEFPNNERVASGLADIHFYKKGYADKAIIHIENDDDQFSFMIEPFLSKVKRYEKYITFTD